MLAKDEKLQEDDIVSFTYDRHFWGIVHQHMGRISRVNGKNWLVQKFQLGRLIVTPIKEVLEIYPRTEKLRAYRFRND